MRRMAPRRYGRLATRLLTEYSALRKGENLIGCVFVDMQELRPHFPLSRLSDYVSRLDCFSYRMPAFRHRLISVYLYVSLSVLFFFQILV